MNKELCYRNNPKSLFRKYAPLVTFLTRHQLFRDYVSYKGFVVPKNTDLLLPNGYREYLGKQGKKHYFQTIVSTKAIFASKLYPALYYLDKAAPFLKTMENAEEFLLGQLGLLKPKEHWNEYRQILEWFPHYAVEDTFNPDANPESTSVDGTAGRDTAGTWAAVRDGAGTLADDLIRLITRLSSGGTNWARIDRGVTLFDTSSIPDGDDISAANEQLFPAVITDNFNQNMDIVVCAPASNTALVTGDYNIANWTMTAQATALDVTNLTLNAYNTWTLNSTGIGNISKTGITKFGTVMSGDMTNTEPTPAAADVNVNPDSADHTNKPKLVVTHAAVGVGVDRGYSFIFSMIPFLLKT